MSIKKINFLEISPCLFAIIIDALGFGLVYPVMTAIFTSQANSVLPIDASVDLRHFYLGLSFMLYPLAMLFGTSFMGDLSDSHGRKKVLILCMIGISISFGLMALGVMFASLVLLLAGRVLSGLMAGSQPIAQAAIADLSTPESKAKNMSVIALAYCFGSVLGPLIGGVTSDPAICSWFNFATPFLLSAGLAFIAALWLLYSFKETYVPNVKKSLQLLRSVLIFKQAWQHPKVRTLIIIFLLMQIGFSIYFQFIIVAMRYLHQYNNWQLGAFQGMIGLGFAIGLLIGMPWCLKRWDVRAIAIIMGVLTGLGQLAVTLIYPAAPQWFLAILIATTDIMVFTAMLTLFSDAVSKERQGWVMGIANAVMALSWAVTGLLANLLNFLNVNVLIFCGGLALIMAGYILKRNYLTQKIDVLSPE